MNEDTLSEDLALAEQVDVESGLTEWEVEFVDSILRQLRRARRPLSEKQRATARRILERLDTRGKRRRP